MNTPMWSPDEAVRRALNDRITHPWAGTMAQLAAELKISRPVDLGQSYPPRALAAVILRLADPLRSAGWQILRYRGSFGARVIMLVPPTAVCQICQTPVKANDDGWWSDMAGEPWGDTPHEHAHDPVVRSAGGTPAAKPEPAKPAQRRAQRRKAATGSSTLVPAGLMRPADPDVPVYKFPCRFCTEQIERHHNGMWYDSAGWPACKPYWPLSQLHEPAPSPSIPPSFQQDQATDAVWQPCRHCPSMIQRGAHGYWYDSSGFPACIKSDLLTGRDRVYHEPMPAPGSQPWDSPNAKVRADVQYAMAKAVADGVLDAKDIDPPQWQPCQHCGADVTPGLPGKWHDRDGHSGCSTFPPQSHEPEPTDHRQFCPSGCGCRLGPDTSGNFDADSRECGCDGPCTEAGDTP